VEVSWWRELGVLISSHLVEKNGVAALLASPRRRQSPKSQITR
jgi:hypothetical protein